MVRINGVGDCAGGGIVCFPSVLLFDLSFGFHDVDIGTRVDCPGAGEQGGMY